MMLLYILSILFVVGDCIDVYISRSDGLYGADRNQDNLANLRLLKPSSGGDIIALAIDTHDSRIFWSDTTNGKGGIYKGTQTATGDISSDTRIVPYDDGIVVTGLAVDWVYKHLYWTDVPHSYVMVADYDGNNRVVAVTSGLLLPRGISVDPIGRSLYLGDQGSHFIMKCEMDGLFDCQNIDRTQHSQIVWPNQLYFNYMDVSARGNISWTDGWSSKVVSCLPDLTGCQETVVTTDSSSFVFGLVNSGSGILVTSLDNLTTYTTQSNDSDQYLPSGNTYYIVSSDTSTQPQPSVTHVCTQNNGGCSKLCFPDGISARCTCPSYSNTVLTGARTCQRADEVLLYIDGRRGHVGMLSTSLIGHTLIAYTPNPASLAYDPFTKMVYFSDSTHQAVYTVSLDGSNLAVFLSKKNSIGSVEAMTLDLRQRRLYFLNKFHWRVDNESLTMVSIEMAGISKPEERVTVLNTGLNITDIEISRGTSSYLYYAVGLPNPGVYKMFPDGRSSTRLSFDVTNPTRLSSIGDFLYILDTTSTGQVLIQYHRSGTYTPSPISNQATYMTSGGSYVYFSSGTSLFKLDTNSATSGDPVTVNVHTVGLLYVNTQETSQADAGLCDNTDLCKAPSVCIKTNNAAIVRCKCPSNKLNIPADGSRSCTAPSKYLLFSDVDGIKMTSLDDASEHDTYTVIPNQNACNQYYGLATDGAKLYFAGYDGKIIYTSSKTGEDVRALRLLRNMTVLSLAYFDHTLYWTGHYDCYYYTNISACESYNGLLGGVFSLDVNTPSSSDSPVITIVSNAVDPNGVVADASALYWTESDLVRRRSLVNSSDIRTIMNTRTYALQQNTRHTHVYAGGSSIIFKKFAAQHFDQQLLFSNVSNVRGMAVEGTLLFASDWDKQNIVQYDLRTHQITLAAENLGRPGQIVVFGVDSTIQDKSGSCPQTGSNLDGPALISCQDDVDCIESYKTKCCLGSINSRPWRKCTAPTPKTSCNITFNAQAQFTWGYEKITNDKCETCGCSMDSGSLVARCTSVQCPPLTGCMYNVTFPRECCPVCRDITTCKQKPTIRGCQGVGTIMLQLPETPPDIRDQPVTFTLADLDQLRNVTAYSCNSQEIPPARRAFNPTKVTWKEDSQVVKLVFQDYNGFAYCDIQVKVLDTTPPFLTSSLEKTIMNIPAKDNNGTKLEWINPIVGDNSGYRPTVTSNEQNGVRKPSGWHQIRYTATDGAGNSKTIEFFFNVSIIPDLTCETPPLFHHGTMECTKDKTTVVSCSANCVRGFFFKSKFPKKYKCVKGQWQPKFDADFASACFEPQPVVISYNTSVMLNCTRSTVNSNNVIDCLQTSGQCFTEGITLCDPRTVTVQQEGSSVTIKAQVSATADHDDQAIQDTNRTLLEKLTSVEDFFLGPRLRQFCPAVACSFLKLDGRTHGRSCEVGAVAYLVNGKQICGKCAVGTRCKTRNGKSECEKCAKNWYQDEEGQMDCKRCPIDTPYSRPGTWLVERCSEKATVTKIKESGLVTIVVGVLAGFVVLALILAAIVVVMKRRRRPTKPKPPQSHDNPVFQLPEDDYDRIPHDEQDNYMSLMNTKREDPTGQYAVFTGETAVAYSKETGASPYATLQNQNAVENPYEKLPLN